MAVKLFKVYGFFCAQYAIEVLVCFLTMVVAAVTLNVSSPYELCNWATHCNSRPLTETELSSDAVVLMLLRCSTILYLYVQIKKLWKYGSLLVVGVVCLYTVFSALTFTITIVHILHKDLAMVMNEALPVFLLLIDISHMVFLTQHCLGMKSIDQLPDYIGEAMSSLMPVITVDTLFQLLLLLSMGSYIEVRQLQQLCCFACLSLIINYLVFTTFVPAILSIYLAASNRNHCKNLLLQSIPSWHDQKYTEILKKKYAEPGQFLSLKTKIFMSVVLLIINLVRAPVQSHFVTNVKAMQSHFDSVFTLTPEQFFTVILMVILASKYLFDDYEIVARLQRESNANLDSECKITLSNINHCTVNTCNLEELDTTNSDDNSANKRTIEECFDLLRDGCSDLLNDAEVISLIQHGKLQPYKLEAALQNANRGVSIRRKLISSKLNLTEQEALTHIPHTGYDFTTATKACCENTVGYVQIPVGLAGPLLLDDRMYRVPMATTEGTLLASTNRGMKALLLSGGVKAVVFSDGMSRAPVVHFPSSGRCCEVKLWLENPYNFLLVKDKFDETSRFGRLKEITPQIVGNLLFIRFVAETGDAMGMNMVSKGTESALRWLQEKFPDMEVVSLSGNFCTDKKPSALNWIKGRGKSVVCEAVLPHDVVKTVLKSKVSDLIKLHVSKNLIGSALAGSIGGFNAHAANIVTAIFIATGQDPAQNVVSSNCITNLEAVTEEPSVTCASCCQPQHSSLRATCTMPSLEVGTVGGGSALEPQKACLKLLGVAGSTSPDKQPGENACELAKIICASVLAGELSLLSALNTGDLVHSHMKHNRLGKTMAKQEIDHNIL